MRFIVALLALAFATTLLAQQPTPQECKTDPAKPGCSSK